MTNWNGIYSDDDELQTQWCKPTEGMRKEMELKDLTRKYIHQSEVNIIYCMSLFCYCNIIKEILNIVVLDLTICRQMTNYIQ